MSKRLLYTDGVSAEDFVDRSIDPAHPARSLLRLMRPHRAKWVASIPFFVVKDSPVWLMPPIIASIIDSVVTGAEVHRILLLGSVGLVLLLLNYPFNMAFIRLTSAATRSLASTVRAGLAQRLTRLSLGAHNRLSSAVIQTKVVRDVESIELLLAQVVPTVLATLSTMTGALVVMALRVPLFLPLFAVTIPLAVALIAWIRKRSGSRNEAFRHEVAGLSATVGEMADLMVVTRGHGLDHVAAASVARRAESVRDAGRALDHLNARFGAITWIAYQALALLCLVGAATASVLHLIPATAGEVVLLSTYFTILTGGLTALLAAAPILARGLDGIRSIGEITRELDTEPVGAAEVNEVRGDIALDRVRVDYPGADAPALDDLSLQIAAGECVAFVGASGSGKSTIQNVILGFVRPTEGRVLIDGRDAAELDMRSVRRRVSIVPQETALLTGSIRANVRYGNDEVGDDEIWDALRQANAAEFVAALPRGLDTVVGDDGISLSGGQRQRLSIARALVRDPRILVLDEATSALDPISESLVGSALESARRGRTTLIVAHRLRTVRVADRVVVVDHGRVIESGTYADLLRAGGAFSRLVAAAEQPAAA